MSVSGVHEDHSVLLVSGPSLVAVWRGELSLSLLEGHSTLCACLTFLYWTNNM